MSADASRTALAIAAAIARGDTTASAEVDAALGRIAASDGAINAFTAVTADRARHEILRRRYAVFAWRQDPCIDLF